MEPTHAQFEVPIRLALMPSEGRQASAHGRSWSLWSTLLVVASFALVASITMRFLGLVAAVAIGALAAGSIWVWRNTKGMAVSNSDPGQILVDSLSLRLMKPGLPMETLVELSPAFGFTLFTTADRSKLVVAITNGKEISCVGTHLGPGERRRFGLLMPHAVTVSCDDLDMAVQSATGWSLWVDSTSLLRLIDLLMQVDATALGRLMLTDSMGRDVVMDCDRLQMPGGVIRLDHPFEWKAMRFGEGPMVEFQGTWIRQGKSEVVLVALVAGDVHQSIHDVVGRQPDAMLGLDARLVDGVRCSPPPLDQRVAIDRLFMLPLRRMLDSAHVERRDSIPGDASVR